jgi:hypothetical protein
VPDDIRTITPEHVKTVLRRIPDFGRAREELTA